MSHFSNQLRVLMEARSWTQTHLSEKTKIPQGTLSRSLNGAAPRRAYLEKLLRAFRPAERKLLLEARTRDLLPAEQTQKPERQRQQHDRAPKPLRAALDYLEAAAIEKPAVAEMLIAAAKILRG